MQRILIIDDDPIIDKVYGNLFVRAGYEVDFATDGKNAMDMLKARRPDLVLLDLFMPKINGVEVLKYIRSKAATRTVPVIVFSTSSTSRHVEAAWAAGANQCLSKDHFDPVQLLEVVRRALATARDDAETSDSSPPEPSPLAATGGPLSLWDAPERVEPTGVSQQAFVSQASDCREDLLFQVRTFVKDGSPAGRKSNLAALFESVQNLAARAEDTGFASIGDMARTLMGLLKELQAAPARINPSALRTVSQAVDCLGVQLSHAGNPHSEIRSPALVLAVDNQTSAHGFMGAALRVANLTAITLDHAFMALRLLEQNHVDLIFLEKNLPGTDSFEFSAQVRAMPSNKLTPLIFFVSGSDFDSISRSDLGGGNDLIAKPLLFPELSAKALAYVTRERLGRIPALH